MNKTAIALFSTTKQNLHLAVQNQGSDQLFRDGLDWAEQNEASMVDAWERQMNTIINYYTFKKNIVRLKSDQYIENNYSTPGVQGYLPPDKRQRCKNEVRWSYYIYIRWDKLKWVYTEGSKKDIDIRGEKLKNLYMSCTPDKKEKDADVEVEEHMDARAITRLLARATAILQPVHFDEGQAEILKRKFDEHVNSLVRANQG